jgi:hypothetical protein
MAGRVFFSVSMSLDGFIAPAAGKDAGLRGDDVRHDPEQQYWLAKWIELQQWVLPQRHFRESVGFGAGGEEGRDNDILRETFARTGANASHVAMGSPHERVRCHWTGSPQARLHSSPRRPHASA